MKICLKNYYIKNFMGSLTNTPAPEFKLADTTGKLISLNHFRGNEPSPDLQNQSLILMNQAILGFLDYLYLEIKPLKTYLFYCFNKYFI